MGAAGVLAGVSVAGTLLSANAQRQQGRAARRAAEFNAQTAEQNAGLVKQQTKEDLRRFRVLFDKEQGSNRAAIGAAGIAFEGSAQDVLEQNARNAELDALTIQHQGDVQAFNFRREAESLRRSGQAAARAADISAVGTLLTGAGQAFLGARSGFRRTG